MTDVIDPGDVVDSDSTVDDDPIPSDSCPDDDLSIFEIDGDYDPDETDGKVH